LVATGPNRPALLDRHFNAFYSPQVMHRMMMDDDSRDLKTTLQVRQVSFLGKNSSNSIHANPHRQFSRISHQQFQCTHKAWQLLQGGLTEVVCIRTLKETLIFFRRLRFTILIVT